MSHAALTVNLRLASCARDNPRANGVQTNASADINGGKMDGFVAQAEHGSKGCLGASDPNCSNGTTTDALG